MVLPLIAVTWILSLSPFNLEASEKCPLRIHCSTETGTIKVTKSWMKS